MSANAHIIFRASKALAESLDKCGETGKGLSLKAKQMVLLAVHDLDRRYMELVLAIVHAMETLSLIHI